MSYLQVIPADGKTDEQRYDEFVTYLFEEGNVEKALEEDYDGEYKGLIQEKIAADLSPVGTVFDADHKDITVARHRAMLIRAGLDAEARKLCKDLDEKIKFDLSEEDLKSIRELELKEDEIEDEIFVRPFALYQVDMKHLYGRDLDALPESAIDFAKMALEHEMDCAYEDSEDDGEWDDEENDEEDDDEEDDEEEDDEEDEGVKRAKAVAAKGKSIVEGTEPMDEDSDDENDEDYEAEEHVHGEGCCHGPVHPAFGLEDDLPFSDDEVTVGNADVGLDLLKDHRSEVVAMLEKLTGAKIESFKDYHFPGRHYVVAWLKDFGVFGVRISYPMLVNDSDDEEDDEEDDDEEDEESDDEE
ncbi:hypothetical protein IWW38_000255 [Coemansia aciculifera]|uniref:Uncharacterized protein n=1 Tax=Coemansia aciculifera TaxID=417176 RepID=A0ACC1MAB7_9FUNG|nr:hypothetical protein IWW38_000255 [Coemansia aciculifera]